MKLETVVTRLRIADLKSIKLIIIKLRRFTFPIKMVIHSLLMYYGP